MKTKYLVFLLLVPYVAEAVFACSTEEPLCDSADNGRYRLKNVTAQHVAFDGTNYNLASSNQILKSNYGMLIHFELDFNVAMMRSPRPFSLFPSAFACSPPIGTFPLDTLTGFSITVAQKFDDTHDAGSDVSQFFEIVNAGEVKTLDQYVSYFGSTIEAQMTTFAVRLKKSPTNAGPFEFNLSVALKDGRTLDVTTSPINLVQ